jgi:hypothetical protein
MAKFEDLAPPHVREEAAKVTAMIDAMTGKG